jgi:hypothetical protein
VTSGQLDFHNKIVFNKIISELIFYYRELFKKIVVKSLQAVGGWQKQQLKWLFDAKSQDSLVGNPLMTWSVPLAARGRE